MKINQHNLISIYFFVIFFYLKVKLVIRNRTTKGECERIRKEVRHREK